MCNASRLQSSKHLFITDQSIQNQLINTLRSQPITHQNYNVKVHLNSQSKRFDLVGKKYESKLLKTNPSTTSGSFCYVRCLRSSLGSSPRICKNSGLLEKLSVFLAHKQEGVKSSFSSIKTLDPKFNQYSCSNLHQQQNSCCLIYINRLGGTRSLELNSLAMKMWV